MKYFLFCFKHFCLTFFSFLSFPETCNFCGKSSFGIPICSCCQKKLISTKIENRCKICGKELFFEKNFCTNCRTENSRFLGFESVYPVFSYVLQKKRLLFLWKIQNHRSMGFFFAKIISNIIIEKYPNIPIVPVPPRQKKILEKGWDQIEDLASILENKYNLSILRILERINETEQKKLSKDERLSKSKNSYMVKKSFLEEIENKKINIPREVIILDDVITTGSTLCSCKDILCSLGIEKIHGLSLFIVP